MRKLILIAMLILATSLLISACGSNGKQDSIPIKATWIDGISDGENLSISAEEVTWNEIAHFGIVTDIGDMTFMAYELQGETYVRANVCPPCRSRGFSLLDDELVCDTCKTTFKATTGEGITGACVDFPKASVSYQVINGRIVMSGNSLIKSYQDTLTPGLP